MSSERPDPLAEPEGYGSQPAYATPEPVTHSPTCTLDGCRMPSSRCVYLGDEAEHIAHLCLCNNHAYQHTRRVAIECTKCHKPMRVISVVDLAGKTPAGEYDVERGLQRLMDWITDNNARADEGG